MHNGRLGNQLFQIAATLTLADENHGLARLKPNWEYKPFFSIPDEYFSPITQGQPTVDGQTEYFQDYAKYIQPLEGVFREYFKPSNGALKKVQNVWCDKFYNHVKHKVIAIHVRRGDYLKWPNHFPIMTSKYFKTSLDKILEKEKMDNLAVVVFSDDIEWCKQNEEFLGLDRFENFRVGFMDGIVRPVEVNERIGDPQDWIDLFLMSMMDYHIISNSTFSWWGAFLANSKAVFYPDRWWGKKIPGHETWRNIIPPDWIETEC